MYRIIKRIFDIIISVCAIVLLSPLFAIISVMIKREDGGSVFYVHNRLGIHKKEINVVKFRSMKESVEPIEKLMTPEQYEQFCREYKLENDPRITKIGRFIRKTYIDEIPQFVNVIQGRMSLVGPRPILKEELEFYTPEEQELFYSVMPGMTGYWQTFGHNTADYTGGKRQQMELYYAKNASLLLDLKILFKTVTLIISCVIGALSGAEKKESTACT